MSRRIATLWDKADDRDRDHDHEDRERGQAYYAGGLHSGQQIIGSNGADFFERTRQSNALLRQPTDGPTIDVTFWRNGFVIDREQNLRSYEDPSNREFLECLRRGETPPSLNKYGAGSVDVKLVNKAQEDFKPQTQVFSGVGHRLGGPTPEVSSKSEDQSSSSSSSKAPQ